MSIKLESIGITITKDKPKMNSIDINVPENQWVQETIKPSVEDAEITSGTIDIPEMEEIYLQQGKAEVIDIFGVSAVSRLRNALRASDVKPINVVTKSEYGVFSKIKLVFLSYSEYNTTINVMLDGEKYITFNTDRQERKYEVDMELEDGKHSISFVSDAYIGNLTIYAR